MKIGNAGKRIYLISRTYFTISKEKKRMNALRWWALPGDTPSQNKTNTTKQKQHRKKIKLNFEKHLKIITTH